MKNSIYLIAAISLITISCKPKFEIEDPSFGEMNPSSYVALGGSSTSGYSDGAYHLNGQENSYVAILAKQFEEVAATSFIQPLASATGINLDGNSRLIMGYKTDCKGVNSLSPVRVAINGDNTILGANIYSSGPFNNIGVPDLDITKINTPGYGNSASGTGNYNEFYSRITSDEINGTVLGDALAQNPTFFTVRLGEQDILNYATSGGTQAMPLTNGATGSGFDGSLDEVLSAMSGTGAKGVIATVPNVVDFPFFNTIPFDGLVLDASQVTTLNAVFNGTGVSFQVGKNPFIMLDPNSPPSFVRQMLPGEKILLSIPLDSVKCLGMGTINPFSDKYILTLEEIDSIQTKTNEYNTIIRQQAGNYGIAVVDLAELYSSLKAGTVYNGISLSTEFVSGGAFSLDGLNLNPRGQSMVANQFLEVINKTFNANIPFASSIKYPGIIFP